MDLNFNEDILIECWDGKVHVYPRDRFTVISRQEWDEVWDRLAQAHKELRELDTGPTKKNKLFDL